MQRDRDETGRPRNARPRDESGRPLPRDAVGVDAVDDEAAHSPDEVLTAAQTAIDGGRPFAAHEYLEVAWHRSPTAERDFWQGLAQIAVGLTHLQRGNTTGAQQLLQRGSERLSSYAGTTPHDVDVDGIRALADQWATELSKVGTVAAPMLQLRTKAR